ncbi:hypothetical protein ATK36_5618 [Amycolatopsis sulphurea]|uniref:Uncharacterized protein n=1 Tax=Amycolatopsis sulphurea TaxID=76022 RepID=A0A2A9FG22_9PSEU|nr:hypothetical protein ATK36_5618 [Amycolatopsis sulphurea]
MKFLEEQIPKPEESEEEADSGDTHPQFRARPATHATDDGYFGNGPLPRRD